MATTRLPIDFKEFLQLLNAHKVEYLLVGGYAVGFHGYPRATIDMDVWVARDPQNAKKLVTVLKDFGFNVGGLSADLFLEENKIIRMGEPPIRIEIITSASGVSFKECYRDRIQVLFDGVPVNFISLQHLKLNKKASGRHKDLDDLENLP